LPKIGEKPPNERREAAMPTPTDTHEHGDRLAAQPLPACLAPTAAQRAAHLEEYRDILPTARLPHAGDDVVIDLGHVMWLIILDDTRPVTQDNSLIMSAGRLAAAPCGEVEWSHAYGVDPDDPNLEPEDAAALPTVHTALIARANKPKP
jgi:hypothetical protein